LAINGVPSPKVGFNGLYMVPPQRLGKLAIHAVPSLKDKYPKVQKCLNSDAMPGSFKQCPFSEYTIEENNKKLLVWLT